MPDPARSRRQPLRRVAVGLVTAAFALGVTFSASGCGANSPSDDVPAVDLATAGERIISELDFVAKAQRHAAPEKFPVPFFEVLFDGSVRPVLTDIPGDLVVDEIHPSANGLIVLRGARDTKPGVRRQDGPLVEHLDFPLVTVDVTGAVTIDRNVRVVGEEVRLLASDGRKAILRRSGLVDGSVGTSRIVAHDFDSGRERDIGTGGNWIQQGDIAGDQLVVTGAESPDGPTSVPHCRIQTIDLSTGSIGHDTTLDGCTEVVDVNASPDGRFAAITYERPAEDASQLHLAIIDVHDMTIAKPEVVGRNASCVDCLYPAHAGYLGMGWSDPTTLRMAFMDPLPITVTPKRALTQVAERLRIETHTTR